MNRPLAAALTAGALLWAAALVAAPAALAHPAWSGPAAHLYRAASGICHQRPERSFHLAGGVPMPVCARCSGLYLSGMAGAILGWIGFARRDDRTRTWLMAAAIPTAATWGLEAAGLMPFSNTARALAALPLGAVAGWVFVRMLRYDAALDAEPIHDSRSRARSA